MVDTRWWSATGPRCCGALGAPARRLLPPRQSRVHANAENDRHRTAGHCLPPLHHRTLRQLGMEGFKVSQPLATNPIALAFRRGETSRETLRIQAVSRLSRKNARGAYKTGPIKQSHVSRPCTQQDIAVTLLLKDPFWHPKYLRLIRRAPTPPAISLLTLHLC